MPAFVTGTLTFFKQTSAPTGWTKQTTNTDYTLRIVSGSGSTSINNSVNFSTGMADVTFPVSVGSVSSGLSSVDADLPSHTHTYPLLYASGTGPRLLNPTNTGVSQMVGTATVQAAGLVLSPGPSPHSHPLGGSATGTGGPGKFAVQYVDFILASKN